MPNGSFQFVEGEYMKAEDYDAFIDDPADWSIRKYWPRVFPELDGLEHAAPARHGRVRHLQSVQSGMLQAPPVVTALQMIDQSDRSAGRADARARGRPCSAWRPRALRRRRWLAR